MNHTESVQAAKLTKIMDRESPCAQLQFTPLLVENRGEYKPYIHMRAHAFNLIFNLIMHMIIMIGRAGDLETHMHRYRIMHMVDVNCACKA
jgi:hypothetical protein